MTGAKIKEINSYLREYPVYCVTLVSPNDRDRLEIRVCDDERILSIPESFLYGYDRIYFSVQP